MSTSVFPRWEGDDTPPFVLRQAEAVAAAGWRVTVLAPHAEGAKRRERMGEVDVVRYGYLWPSSLQGLFYDGGMLVQLRKHPHRKWQLPFMLAAQIAATRRLCSAKRFDLLHAHSLLPQGLTALYNGRLPVVATSHGNDVFGLSEGGIYGKLKRKVVGGVRALTANSSATEAALLKLGASSESVHRVPASPNVTVPIRKDVAEIRASYPAGVKLILFAGRLIEEKGVGDLLQAMKALPEIEVRLLLLGEGADRQRFERMSNELNLNDRVEFLGWQSKQSLANYMAAADVFVGPSKPGPGGWVEAQGLVFVEAMAAGLPIVATRCGGIPDMIIDKDTGLLVDPGAPKAIASAVSALLGSPDVADQLARQAKERYHEAFSPERVTAQLLGVYESTLANKIGESRLI